MTTTNTVKTHYAPTGMAPVCQVFRQGQSIDKTRFQSRVTCLRCRRQFDASAYRHGGNPNPVPNPYGRRGKPRPEVSP